MESQANFQAGTQAKKCSIELGPWQAVHDSEGNPLTPGQWIVQEMSVRSGGRSAGFPVVDAAMGCPPFHGDDEDDDDEDWWVAILQFNRL